MKMTFSLLIKLSATFNTRDGTQNKRPTTPKDIKPIHQQIYTNPRIPKSVDAVPNDIYLASIGIIWTSNWL